MCVQEGVGSSLGVDEPLSRYLPGRGVVAPLGDVVVLADGRIHGGLPV